LGAINGNAREQINIATTYYLQGSLVKAVEAASEGLRLARDIDYKLFVPYGLTGLARVEHALGNYLKARDLNVEALELSRETQDTYVEIEAMTSLAFASTALRDYPAASAYSERAIELARKLGSDSRLMGAVLARADLIAARGQYERATKLVAIVLYHPATVSYERVCAEKLLAAIKSHLSSGEQEAAKEFARTAPLEKAVEDAIKYPLT
jgi:tetratricopeptide (TPR) repeat protein